MSIEVLDIVDTGVKIGLGALISGVSALVLAKAKYHGEISKEKLSRRRAIIEDAAEKVELFCNTALRYYAFMVQYARVKGRGEDPSSELEERQSNGRAELFGHFIELASAEAKLILIGQNDCQKIVREFGESLDDFYRRKWEFVSEDQAKSFRSGIIAGRHRILLSLQEAYKKQ